MESEFRDDRLAADGGREPFEVDPGWNLHDMSGVQRGNTQQILLGVQRRGQEPIGQGGIHEAGEGVGLHGRADVAGTDDRDSSPSRSRAANPVVFRAVGVEDIDLVAPQEGPEPEHGRQVVGLPHG